MNWFFLLLFLPIWSWACSNADPSKVIIFVDTNNSYQEIETAQNSACARGETIIILPRNFEEMNASKIKQKKIEKDDNQCISNECKKARLDFDKLATKQLPIAKQLEKELSNLRKNDATLTSFIISGHDGGGYFSGGNFETNRRELADVFKQYPDVNKTSSVLLLGCYTGVRKEMEGWKSLFPEVRMIAGYDVTAPLSDKPLGHDYIREILENENELLVSGLNNKEMTAHIKGTITSLVNLNASLYLKPYCEEEEPKELFFGHTDPVDPNVKRLITLDQNSCTPKVEKRLREIQDIFLKYKYPNQAEKNQDVLNPLVEANHKEIKSIYAFTRQYEHCIDAYSKPINLDAQQIFDLIFLEEEIKNFAHFYQKEFDQVEAIINKSNFLYQRVWPPTLSRLESKTYAEILQNIRNMHELLTSQGLSPEQREALRFSAAAMSRHLQYFQNPFSWFNWYKDKPSVEAPKDPEKLDLPKKKK